KSILEQLNDMDTNGIDASVNDDFIRTLVDRLVDRGIEVKEALNLSQFDLDTEAGQEGALREQRKYRAFLDEKSLVSSVITRARALMEKEMLRKRGEKRGPREEPEHDEAIKNKEYRDEWIARIFNTVDSLVTEDWD